jgi:hypothetical protein
MLISDAMRLLNRNDVHDAIRGRPSMDDLDDGLDDGAY